MAEIKEILDKHDIAGIVVLHTPGHGEHMMKVDPSYSCAFVDMTPGKEGVRVRTRLQEDYGGDSAKRDKAQQDTVNMFDILTDLVTLRASQSIDIVEMLRKHFEIKRTGGNHSSHTSQNN